VGEVMAREVLWVGGYGIGGDGGGGGSEWVERTDGCSSLFDLVKEWRAAAFRLVFQLCFFVMNDCDCEPPDDIGGGGAAQSKFLGFTIHHEA
jgi:hypothetical protein